jgi:hypothetical protein
MKLKEDKFDIYLKYLNHFTNIYFQWQPTNAIKEHIDEYGVKINIGDIYYKREHLKSHSDVLKLSKDSMDKLLYIMIEGNNQFQSYGQYLENKQLKDIQDALERIR